MARKRTRKTWRDKALWAAPVVAAGVLPSMAAFLILTMAPTIVAFWTDLTPHKARAMAVGAMNLAGAAPFLLELWRHGGDMAVFAALAQWPMTYLASYSAAALGLAIDWAMVGMVSAILLQKAQARLARIEEQQKKAVERWGPEVARGITLAPVSYTHL